MSPPRAALLFGLLLASSAIPAAAVDFPKWAVTDESYDDWPAVNFNNGAPQRGLYCRRSECDPAKNKGMVNLYAWTQTSRVPIKSKINHLVDRSSWNPLRLFRDPYYLVEEVIDSHLTTYASKLSHYKLDLSTPSFQVVQGNRRFPASSSLGRPGLSETGSKIHVTPPTVMADDKLPAAPAPGTPPVTPVAPDASAVTLLTAQELRWLSRAEKRAYETARTPAESVADDKNAALKRIMLKRIVDDFRAKVKANLRPEALPNYEKALNVTKTTAAIDASLISVKMWGGTVTAPVAAFGPKTEIQLTELEYAALKKKPAAYEKYNDDRSDINGGKEDEPFNQSFDPIALHQVTIEARKAIGGTTAPAGPGGTPAASKPQFEAEAKNQSEQFQPYMTENELAAYKNGLHGKTGAALLEYNQEQLKKIAGRTPYPKNDQAFTEAQFAALEGWKQQRYCESFRRRSSPTPTQNKTPAANSKTALTTLETCDKEGGECRQLESNKAGSENIVDASGDAGGWASKRCKALGLAVGIGGSTNGKPSIVPPVGGTGSGDEKAAPKENPWLAKPLLYSAVKGALVGALVGSLFGPGGAILGALIGAAIFYGVTKWTE